MKRIKPERVAHALHRIHEWALTARTQAAVHLWPLLALLEKDAGIKASVEFEESDDRDFWDKYFLLMGGDAKPYFNPITFRRAEQNFPHSNAATVRKNTFDHRWHAGTMSQNAQGKTLWSLSDNYAVIFRDRVLIKQGVPAKIPLIDVAIVLFRNEEFPDNATAETVLQRFRDRFKQRDQDFNELFHFQGEQADALFTAEKLNVPGDYNEAISGTLVPEKMEAPQSSGLIVPTPLSDVADPILTQVQQLLSLGTSGIIFRGPPGTGKTWYAQKIAANLVSDPQNDIFRVQFHPSYGYEDFVEGYRPDDASTSGFNIVQKKFLDACNRARSIAGYVVFIIDEINRGDPARIFGELLTYIEREYRGEEFLLPFSGDKASVPENLLLLGTMNPYDRSVAQIDAAFIRRFDHIEIEPSSDVVEAMLRKNGKFDEGQIDLIVEWFEKSQALLGVGLGHAFFKDVKDLDTLRLVWKYRILPTSEAMLEQFNPTRRAGFVSSFDALIARLEQAETQG